MKHALSAEALRLADTLEEREARIKMMLPVGQKMVKDASQYQLGAELALDKALAENKRLAAEVATLHRLYEEAENATD